MEYFLEIQHQDGTWTQLASYWEGILLHHIEHQCQRAAMAYKVPSRVSDASGIVVTESFYNSADDPDHYEDDDWDDEEDLSLDWRETGF